MAHFKIVKPYKIGNSQAVRIPSAYRVAYENARVYKKSTPTSVKISYVFPKKHVQNAFSSGSWNIKFIIRGNQRKLSTILV